ncbi:hypothetical protein AGMMS49944_22400 [Spirochaetia bacterium]|nr:hypothetical protein AGMMS49944_22400 [Spirochaetia bacterium]
MDYEKIYEATQDLDAPLQSVEDGLPVSESLSVKMFRKVFREDHLEEDRLQEMGNYKKKQIADYLYRRLGEARTRISKFFADKDRKEKSTGYYNHTKDDKQIDAIDENLEKAVRDTINNGEFTDKETGKLTSPFRMQNNNGQIITNHWKEDNSLVEEIFSNLNLTAAAGIAKRLANTIEGWILGMILMLKKDVVPEGSDEEEYKCNGFPIRNIFNKWIKVYDEILKRKD